MNPPTMTVAPFGIMATASSSGNGLHDCKLRSAVRAGTDNALSVAEPAVALICIKAAGSSAASLRSSRGARCTPIPSSMSFQRLRTSEVTAFDGRIHGIAERQQIGAFQEQDLRLHQPAALEFDPAQRHRERILRLHVERQQGRRPDRGVDGMRRVLAISMVNASECDRQCRRPALAATAAPRKGRGAARPGPAPRMSRASASETISASR